ncbi:hypothetical protein [Streptomyces sp. NPDC057301]
MRPTRMALSLAATALTPELLPAGPAFAADAAPPSAATVATASATDEVDG